MYFKENQNLKYPVSVFWSWKTVILLNLLVVIPLSFFSATNMSFGSAFEYYVLGRNGFWQTIDLQSENLLSNISCGPNNFGCHEEKMVFRLFLPLLYISLFKTPFYVVLTQYFIGILASVCLIRIVYDACGDKTLTILVYLSILFTYTGSAYIFDIVTCADSFAYSFFIFAIYFRNRLIIFFFLSLAYWVDERAVICSGFIGIYWLLSPNFDWKITLKNSNQVAAVFISVLLYFMIRWFLSYKFKLSTPSNSANFSYLLGKGTFINIMRTVRSIEGIWVITFLSIYLGIKDKLYINTFVFLSYFILVLTVSLCVADTSRSMGYGIVGLVVAFIVTIKNYNTNKIKLVMAVILALNIVIPTRYLF